jgi:hypothetical protein
MPRLLLLAVTLAALLAAPAGAATLDADGSRLVFTGTDADDTLTVDPVAGGWTLAANAPLEPTPSAAAACTVTGAVAVCRQDARFAVRADGGRGDDRLTMLSAAPGEPVASFSARGGEGADVLTGSRVSDWLDGRDGRRGDRLHCGGGSSDFAGLDAGDVVVGCERQITRSRSQAPRRPRRPDARVRVG